MWDVGLFVNLEKYLIVFVKNLKCLIEILEWKYKLLIVMVLKIEIVELVYYSSMMWWCKFFIIICILLRW